MEELRVQEDLPGSQEIREALKAGWIQVHEVKDKALAQVLERDLDMGEAETIALAIQAKSVWPLLDEKEARKIAKSLGLKVTGILGILLRARNEGTLPSLKKAMDQLQNLAGFYIGAELTISLLRESGEGD